MHGSEDTAMKGGFWHIGSMYALRGVSPNSTNTYKGRVGVKKPEIFAYILYGWPLMGREIY